MSVGRLITSQGTAGNVQPVLRLLFTRRWLGWLLVGVLWAGGSVYLGHWQWSRYERKALAQHQVSDNYNGTPRSATSVLPTQHAQLAAEDKWTQVRLTGRYLASDRLLARNRSNDGDYGYEVLIPFRASDGRTWVVDRGWLPNGRTAAAPDSIPATPGGTITLTGWLLSSEPLTSDARIPGQIPSINLPRVEQLTGQDVDTGAYVLMRNELTSNGTHPKRPTALPAPDPGSYSWVNFSYALQWWAAAIGGFVFFGFRLRREYLEQDPRRQAAGRSRKPPKPKKVRIWDEEDE